MKEEIIERVQPGTIGWRKYSTDHVQRYNFFKDYYKGKTVLDAACGSGYGSMMMIDGGAREVVGIDISDDAITFAQENYNNPSLAYLKHSCDDLSLLNRKFDLVISFETIEHLSSPEHFIKEVKSVLNEGGLFICSTPNKKRYSGLGWAENNQFHLSELYYEEFSKIFKQYFTVLSTYHQSESIPFFRYLELRHMLKQLDSRMKASIAYRVEILLRKIFRKSFNPIPFYHDELDYFHENDYVIEPLTSDTTSWHKTYIMIGKLK